FFFYSSHHPLALHSFPTRRSSDLTLRWLPISGYVDPLQEPLAGIRSLALPAITLGMALAAVITRTLRSSLLEVLSEDYVRTARRSEEHTSELQSPYDLVCRLLLEK